MNPLQIPFDESIDLCENQIETVVASPNSECSPSESRDKTSAKELVGTQFESVEVESTCMSLGTAEMDSKHNSACSTSDEEEKFAEQSLSPITAQKNRKPNTVCSTSDEEDESVQESFPPVIPTVKAPVIHMYDNKFKDRCGINVHEKLTRAVLKNNTKSK